MHIHILGICGTFMGSLALLARELGYRVTGVDAHVYPPMSTQLEEAGISLLEGYENHGLQTLKPDMVIVGNAMSRGNIAVEYMLDHGLYFQSGPQWLAEHVLKGKHVLAVAGTHGKTTTSSMLAWILEGAGFEPGFLIGGVPENFGQSARLGGGKYFVIEADEYDTAFFDKRSKFIHYLPNTLILNNLEFDHADIFERLSDIQKQFHHLVRTVPSTGNIIAPVEKGLEPVMEKGCWSKLHWLNHGKSDWRIYSINESQSRFSVIYNDQKSIDIDWRLCGLHNIENALAAIAAAMCIDIEEKNIKKSLETFVSVKRRMQLLANINDIHVYDDFAHHPTAIKTTLQGAKAKYPDRRILLAIEPRSNTMKMGIHNHLLQDAIKGADIVWWYEPSDTLQENSIGNIFLNNESVFVLSDYADLVKQVVDNAQKGDVIIVMSNGGFGGVHLKIVNALDK